MNDNVEPSLARLFVVTRSNRDRVDGAFARQTDAIRFLEVLGYVFDTDGLFRLKDDPLVSATIHELSIDTTELQYYPWTL